MSLVCNYAIARFLPYALTEEFVNVGVVIHCADTGYLDFRLTKRWGRATDFFPEISGDLYREAMHALKADLQAMRSTGNPQQGLMLKETDHFGVLFRELVRPRESLLRFSTIRTAVTANPAEKLAQIFQFYVERQFALDQEYQEALMRRHLQTLLLKSGVGGLFKPQQVGDENYVVPFPFVQRRGDIVFKAIKPLDLAKNSSTRIYEHGDQWINRIRRLQKIGKMPGSLLFPVRLPAEVGARSEAAGEIMQQLRAMETQVVPASQEQAVVDFAIAA